jgi:hypothetical protein
MFFVHARSLSIMRYEGNLSMQRSIKEGALCKRFFFLKSCVPISKVTKISMGSSFGLSRSMPMYCYYQNEKNEEKYIFTTLSSHDPNAVLKFLADITALNAKVVVDEELYRWLEKKKKKIRQ